MLVDVGWGYWRVLEGTGEGTGGYWGVLEGTGGDWRVLEATKMMSVCASDNMQPVH